ncbi:SPOR domain-containing protein [Candidatus Desantisbacteria bacterium]|nr:SPOR domain-containing protein [Candidatus Desantisbacteria bacterium]
MPVDLGDKGTWYRLRAGKYKTQEEAKSGIWELNSIGFKNVVVTPY